MSNDVALNRYIEEYQAQSLTDNEQLDYMIQQLIHSYDGGEGITKAELERDLEIVLDERDALSDELFEMSEAYDELESKFETIERTNKFLTNLEY